MSAGRNAEAADAIKAHGYDLKGFAPAVAFRLEGRRTLVSASISQNLCAFVQHRHFRCLELTAARSLYPFLFA